MKRPLADPAPPRPLARGRKSARKRERIVRAAIEIINVKSYALASMTEIAASLDLRDATLYYYFPNKQALAYECHVRSLERFERLLREADEAGESGADKLDALMRGLLDDSDANGPQLYFGDHSYLNDEQRVAVDGWAERMTGELEQFLVDGIADGSIAPCETTLVVQLLLGMLIWLGRWVPRVEGLTPDRLMAAMRVFSLEGLRTEAAG